MKNKRLTRDEKTANSANPKRGRGRPSLPEDQRLGRQLRILLPNHIYDDLERTAAARGITVSALARERLAQTATRLL